MCVNPTNHFSDNIREIRPYHESDGQNRGHKFFRRFCNSGGSHSVRLMDGAKAGMGGATTTALTARAEVKAWALVRACGEHTDRGRARDAKIPAVIVWFG